jgi:transcriptional regulator with XRE-family HTH domain
LRRAEEGYRYVKELPVVLSDQIRLRRLEQNITLTELARRSQVSKGYLSQLENNPQGPRPSADVLYRIAFALGTSIGALLEKQFTSMHDELTDIPGELRRLALTEQIPEEEIKMLARITFRGRRPCTVDGWKYLYESIKRSVGT